MAFLITGFVLAVSAAATPPATLAAQAAAPRPARTRRICRDVSRVGSRLRSYRCMTQNEWADYERQNADATRDTQEDARHRADEWYGPEPGVPRP